MKPVIGRMGGMKNRSGTDVKAAREALSAQYLRVAFPSEVPDALVSDVDGSAAVSFQGGADVGRLPGWAR